ncbi:MAG: type III-A CRISPR-associated protein Csm2 [bacterium]
MDIKFWRDKTKKQLDPDLFSTKADELANQIAQKNKINNKLNNPTQIRKFYDEVIRFNSIVKTNPNDFENILPYLKMLNAKVAYAMGRGLLSEEFKDFISTSLNQIKDKDDFDAFAGLFEAFMGYYKLYAEKNKHLRG